MLRRIAALAATLVFAFSACAFAQAPRQIAPDCPDDNGTDRCDPGVQRSVREKYGLQSIEALASSGAEVRRALFVDGYGNDMPSVAFERRPGVDPFVAVTVLVQDDIGGARMVVLNSQVPLSAWNELIEETRHFDRELVPLPPSRGELETICLHGWVVTMEAAEASDTARKVRRRTESACADGLAVDAAFAMARRAFGLLAQCSALSPPQYRNEVALFETCAVLEGDRIAAGEAVNQFTELQRRNFRQAPADLVGLVADDPVLEWPSEAPVRGREAAEEFWARHMRDMYVRARRVHGEESNRVRITGRIVTPSDKDDRTSSAPIDQIWTREHGFGFRLREMRVGAFERDPAPK